MGPIDVVEYLPKERGLARLARSSDYYQPLRPITAPIVSAPAVAPRALRSPARIACLPCVRDCRLEIASPRPRPVCSRTGIEPDNDDTDTAATMSIDGLFYLSVPSTISLRGWMTKQGQSRIANFSTKSA